MEDVGKSFNTICRVCLSHENLNQMVSLLDSSQETGLSIYGLSFEDITKISVNRNPYLPMNLCLKCKDFLEAISNFTMACEVSDKKLRKLIKFSLKQELDDVMIKEVIRQYTLFSQNFLEDLGTGNRLGSSHHSQNAINGTKPEGYSKIKVEIEKQNVNCGATPVHDNMKSQQMDTDVDIFIYSVKKLLSTNINDIKSEAKMSNNEITTKNQDITKVTRMKKLKTEQDLTCKVCQKVLATEKTYKNHIQRHGVCRFVCDQCGKGFPINAELVQHQIHSHGAGSQYQCDICSYRAVKKIQLIEHIRLHTGERPFTCEKCGLTFRRKTLYNKHAKFHGERTVQCDLCPRMFFVRSAMLAHRNSRHSRQYIYSCRICNITYAMARTVKKHMLDKHGIPRHLQGKIQKTYKNDVRENLFESNLGEEITFL